MTTIKHRKFVSEPMKDKPATDVPGIGKVLGEAFAQKGITQASQIHAIFLRVDEDKDRFLEWMRTFGANAQHRNACYEAMKEWTIQYGTTSHLGPKSVSPQYQPAKQVSATSQDMYYQHLKPKPQLGIPKQESVTPKSEALTTNQQLFTMRHRLVTPKQEYDTHEWEYAFHEEKYKDLKQGNDELIEKNNELLQENSELKKEIRELKSENFELIQENYEQELEIVDLKKQIETLSLQLESFRAERKAPCQLHEGRRGGGKPKDHIQAEKFKVFTTTRMGSKSVIEVPGVSDVIAGHLAKKRITKAWHVYEKFLQLNKDQAAFDGWFMCSGGDDWERTSCYLAMEHYYERFGTEDDG